MKWGRMHIFPHFYINFSTFPSLLKLLKTISLSKSVTPATLSDIQSITVADASFSCHPSATKTYTRKAIKDS